MSAPRHPRIHADAVVRMLNARAVKFGDAAKLSSEDRMMRSLLLLASQTITQQQADSRNQLRMMEAACCAEH